MKLQWLFVVGVFAMTNQVAQGRWEDKIDVDSARHEVQVQLEPAQAFVPATDNVWMTVTFVNGGADPVTLTNWFVPGEELDGQMFDVARNGQAVAYVGPLVKRGTPVSNDLIVLQPGEALSVRVDLSAFYDFSADGEYTVSYRARSSHLFGPDQVGAATLMSSPVAIAVQGNSGRLHALKAKPGTGAGSCSATQQSTIASAIGAAKTMAAGAKTYLGGNASGTPRYVTWFGAFTSSRWNTAEAHFVAIDDAFQTQNVVVDCSCKKSYYAYVYPTQPYKIYVCNAFWNAPLTGTDSKGGTLIHEMSHFNVVAGTDDWAYGQSAAKSLALSDPAKALDNADSHEYFAENTPAQK